MIFSLSKENAVAGGAKGGQYLQEIGETDLAKLNVSQFGIFCERVVAGAWQAALDHHIANVENVEPPF